MTEEPRNLGAWTRRLRDVGLRTHPVNDEIDALDNAIGFAAEHARRYITSGGADDGWDGPRPILILYTRGRRSGHMRRNPLLYFDYEGMRLVVGSKGGADTDPAWYLNLQADPLVHVRVGTRFYAATASTLTGAERDRAWCALVKEYPMHAEYQERTPRPLPLVRLTAVDELA